MLPIIGLALAAASTLTAGQAVLIGGTIGAVTAFGTNALKQKDKARDVGKDNDDESDKEIINEAVREALRIIKKRHNI